MMSLEAPQVICRTAARFDPSACGDDYFINHISANEEKVSCSDQFQVLKEEVRKMLAASTDKPSQKLNLIDATQRLGVAYHFKDEIDEALLQIHEFHEVTNIDGNLYTVSLQFRLLRQQGYYVSSDIFNKFKDGVGNFKEDLIRDVQGMLSLYEASYLGVRGEDILDEALEFTKAHLKSMVPHLSSTVADQVRHALKWPTRMEILRKEAWHCFTIYQQDSDHIEALLKFAKLDFNLVQKLNKKELSIITKKLPFARDRAPECFFWALGAFPEPQYVSARRLLTKAIVMMSIMDEIYEVHGAAEELELFTKVVERWDVGRKDELPDYMKLYLQALIEFYDEIGAITSEEGRSFCIHYAKEAVKNQVRAYMTEARWFDKLYVPTLEEYLSVGIISSIYPILFTIALCGMGNIASEKVFDWLFCFPKILNASSGIARLIDDIRSHEPGQETGHAASAVECYMKQYGVSKQQACIELNKVVVNLWKDLNAELLNPPDVDVPKPILTCIFNFACVIDVVYKDEDGYMHSETVLKDVLAALLVDPVSV